VVLITIPDRFPARISNPAVSLVFALQRDMTPRDASLYVMAQIAGGIAGTVLAHAMFALPLVDASLKVRTGGRQWLAEGVAASAWSRPFWAGIRFNRPAVPVLVGFTSPGVLVHRSTSFANPAVAIARSLTIRFRIRGRSSRLHRGRTLRRGRWHAGLTWMLRPEKDAPAPHPEADFMSVTIYHTPPAAPRATR